MHLTTPHFNTKNAHGCIDGCKYIWHPRNIGAGCENDSCIPAFFLVIVSSLVFWVLLCHCFVHWGLFACLFDLSVYQTCFLASKLIQIFLPECLCLAWSSTMCCPLHPSGCPSLVVFYFSLASTEWKVITRWAAPGPCVLCPLRSPLPEVPAFLPHSGGVASPHQTTWQLPFSRIGLFLFC